MRTLSNLLTNERIGDTAIFSAPLGAVKKGHLEITSGISNFDLSGAATTQKLFEVGSWILGA